MKRLCSLTFLMMLLLTAFTSCGSDDEEGTTPITPPAEDGIIFEGGAVPEILVDDKGSSQTVYFKTNKKWLAQVSGAAKSWLAVSPAQGEAGNVSVTIKAQANEGHDSRSGQVTITAGTVKKNIAVTQMQKDAIVVAQPEYEMDAKGGELVIKVGHNVDFDVAIDADWIKQASTRAYEEEELTFTISENTGKENRKGAITFTSKDKKVKQTVQVVQMQKDAIVLAKPEYEMEAKGGELAIKVGHNVDFDMAIDVDWISKASTRAYVEEELVFTVKENAATDERKGTITFTSKDKAVQQTVKVIQKGNVSLKKEREALAALYNATGGPNWTKHANWCSDKPLSEWYGVETDEEGHVAYLDLFRNNLKGQLPDKFGDLPYLKRIYIVNNQLSGTIPESIGRLKYMKELLLGNNKLTGAIPESIIGLSELTTLNLGHNQLSGSIPESIGNMTGLRTLMIDNNKLSGAIPESIGNLTHLTTLSFHNNNLSGKVPQGLTALKVWNNWPMMIRNTLLDIKGADLPGPEFKGNTIYDKPVSDKLYTQHKLTIVFGFMTGCVHSHKMAPVVSELYNKCKEQGLGAVSFTPDDDEMKKVKDFAKAHGMTWDILPQFPKQEGAYFSFTKPEFPQIYVVDPNGQVVFAEELGYQRSELKDFIGKYFDLGEDTKLYESTDFSKDGRVKVLQKATKGKGIDLILMADGFSDRQIASGQYDNLLEVVRDIYFGIEPYASFKELFNVYAVTAVSKNEGYIQKGSTALEGKFGQGVNVYGNYDKCLKYALKAIPESRMDDAVIAVVMNSPLYGGTCAMMKSEQDNDWGSGTTVAFFPKGLTEDAQNEQLQYLTRHEVGGHGFAKLDDEYFMEENGRISEEVAENLRKEGLKGYWKNVDFTSDPDKIKWSKFLKDKRYDSEQLGIFEGGSTFFKGVWRPSENSIMSNATDYFNAPSREAIYYRMHKLAYGADWKYDYEDFVEYDAVNRKPSTKRVEGAALLMRPTHAPVMIGKTWREMIR